MSGRKRLNTDVLNPGPDSGQPRASQLPMTELVKPSQPDSCSRVTVAPNHTTQLRVLLKQVPRQLQSKTFDFKASSVAYSMAVFFVATGWFRAVLTVQSAEVFARLNRLSPWPV